jgi:hypothetical protein
VPSPRSCCFYGSVATNEFDAPRSLLTVAEMEAMVCNSVFPVGGVPCRVNGKVTVNWPPKDCEPALWNHSVAACRTSMVTCEVPIVMLAAAVNCRVTDVFHSRAERQPAREVLRRPRIARSSAKRVLRRCHRIASQM